MADEMKLRYTTEVDTSGAVKGMADVEKAVNNTGKKAEETGKKVEGIGSSKIVNRVKGLINPFTLVAGAVTTLGYSTVKAVKDFALFEKQMSKVNTLLKVGKDDLKKYRAEVQKLAKNTGMAKAEISEGLYQALSAGITSEESMKFMEIATKTAIAGFTDVNTAVDGLTTVLNAYKMETKEATRIADIFLKGQELGKLTVDEIGKSIGNLASIAASAGVSVENLVASLSTMTANGIPASEAATQLKQAMAQLTNSGSTASKAFQELTGKSFKEFIQQGGTLTEAFDKIERVSKKTGKSIGELMGSVEAGNAVLSLTGLNGAKAAENLNKITAASGTLEEAYKNATDNIMDDWSKLTRTMDTIWKQTVGKWEKPIRVTLQVITEHLDKKAERNAFIAEQGPGFEQMIRQQAGLIGGDVKGNMDKIIDEMIKKRNDYKKQMENYEDPDVQLDLNYTGEPKKPNPQTVPGGATEIKSMEEYQKQLGIAKAEFRANQLKKDEEFYQKVLETRTNGVFTERELESQIQEYEYNKWLTDQEFKLQQLEEQRLFLEGKQGYELQYAQVIAEIQKAELEKIERQVSEKKRLQDEETENLEEARRKQEEIDRKHSEEVEKQAKKMRELESTMAEGMADAANLLIAGQIKGLEDLTKYLAGKLLVTTSEAVGQVTTQALTLEALAKGLLSTPGGQAAGVKVQAAAAFNWATIPKIMAVKMIGGIGQAMMSTASTNNSSSGGGSGGDYGTASTDKSEIAKEDDKEKFLEINTDRRDILAALLPDLDQAMKDGYNIRLIPKS